MILASCQWIIHWYSRNPIWVSPVGVTCCTIYGKYRIEYRILECMRVHNSVFIRLLLQRTFRKRSDNNKDSPGDGTCGVQKYVWKLSTWHRYLVHIKTVLQFLVNKTDKCTKFQLYWYYNSTGFGQSLCPSSGVLAVQRRWYNLCSFGDWVL
jgi:hypothetical protein